MSIRSIVLSVEEKASGVLTLQHAQRALEALHEDGIVLIEDAVDHAHLDKLNEQMVKDAFTLRDSLNSPYNYNRGNIQQDPPPTPDLFFPDVFLNPFAVQVSNAYLGHRPKMTFNSGNTALRGTESQPVHTDADIAFPNIPFAVVINTGLIEMNPTNGSTELWLGTHPMATLEKQDGLHGERASGMIKADLLAERRKVSPPFQPTVPKGAVLVRDLRLWHCGKPNLTDEPRVMLAQIHFAPWYRNPMRLEFPKGMEAVVHSNPDLEVPTDFVDGTIDYLRRAYGNAYDFGQSE